MALHGEDAYERKLRVVYDALDARSFKVMVGATAAAASQPAVVRLRGPPNAPAHPCCSKP